MAVVTAGWLGLVAVIALHRPPWGDEEHYLETVQVFGRDMGVETLRTYNELPPPLALALYAWWGRLVGFDTPRLRLLSLAIAFLTVMAVHALARRVLQNGPDALVATLFFLLHPYTIGLSVFVFNDMPAIFFAVLMAIGIAADRPALVGLASAAGLMTRQYFAFLTAAAVLYYAMCWIRRRRARDLAGIVGLGASGLPLAGMFLLWGGLAPVAARRVLYLAHGLSLNPASVTLYVTQLFTYLCPLLLWRPSSWMGRSPRWWAWIGGASLLYWLAPVRPAPPQVAAGMDTIGLLHRAIRATIGQLGVAATDVFFWIAFGLGLSVLASVVRDVVSRRDAEWPDTRTFLGLAVLCFLTVMPFSYMHWEKYFMPLLPLAAVLVLAIREDGIDRPGASASA